jgi:2-methylcitrate dehydratase PrpD
VKEYSDACVNDPAVLALRAKVSAEDDASIPADAAVVSLRTTSGDLRSAHIAHARGSLARPLSDRELEAKFRDLAAYGAPGIEADRLIPQLWVVERIDDIGEGILRRFFTNT